MQNPLLQVRRETAPDAKVPVQYDQACRALAECQRIDEAKYWDNKADALAAWAKIYKSGQATLEAKRLKLHAYRRMGQLAAEIRSGGTHPSFGSKPGAHSVLRESGLSKNQATMAISVSKIEPQRFDSLVSSSSPPSPWRVSRVETVENPAWALLRIRLVNAKTEMLRHDPVVLAKTIQGQSADRRHGNQIANARNLAVQMIEWLDRFEQALPD